MQIHFATRQTARNFAQQRTAKGLKSPVIDNGKEALAKGTKRYAVDISQRVALKQVA